MTKSQVILRAAAAMAAAVLTPTAALAAGSIKAAYVEEVIPSKTFAGRLSVYQNHAVSTGPGTGVMGVTSIMLTNFDPVLAQQVFIFEPTYSGGNSCGAAVTQYSDLQFTVYVPAKSTVQFTYPTPLVFNPINGQTCMAAMVLTPLTPGYYVDVMFNGVVN